MFPLYINKAFETLAFYGTDSHSHALHFWDIVHQGSRDAGQEEIEAVKFETGRLEDKDVERWLIKVCYYSRAFLPTYLRDRISRDRPDLMARNQGLRIKFLRGVGCEFCMQYPCIESLYILGLWRGQVRQST